VLRNLGVALAHSLIAFGSVLKGLDRLAPAPERMAADLEENWEVLGEAIQTVMRRYGLPNPYERLKEFTRGRRVGRAEMVEFIRSLELPDDAKRRLVELTPASYVGLAETLARDL